MRTLIIQIDPDSLPIHSSVLYVNDKKERINSNTCLQLLVGSDHNTIRINDAGIKLGPTSITVLEGQTKQVFIGVRKGQTKEQSSSLMGKIWNSIKSALDFDLEFYVLIGL